MKTLNAKRITTLAAGAALLGIGVAFGGAITFQNVPIISSSGQPLVQVVVGSTAQPIDAVSAGNIAAAIGNLAYASVPVTATVNATQAASVLKVQVTSASYSLANQQVWLNESGAVGSSAGTYTFGALIGSVLNGAILLSSPQSTKSLQSGQYSFANTAGAAVSLTASPPDSPFSASGSVPVTLTPSASSNGGGFSLSSFSTGNQDNVMQITNSQLSSLLNNYGNAGETETLWLTGFPVYNQNTGAFNLMSAGGAYQVTFAKPIQNRTGSGGLNINVPIQLLGQNWTIINATGAGTTGATTTTAIHGGRVWLASSLAPLTTVYVGQNLTSGQFRVQLTDLGQPNGNGISMASLNVYTNGVLTNTSQVAPGSTTKFNVTGQTLFVSVNQTFAGLYAYQKWAKMQLYSNVYEVQDGKVFNKTNNPGWYANLLWTNTSSSSSAAADALQSIILYNVSPQTLTPGQSFNFIQKPAYYKLTFIGDQFGASNFDSVSAALSQSSQTYANAGTQAGNSDPKPTNITEPAELLTVTSGINNAFTFAGQTSSSVTYDLTPYTLSETANAAANPGGQVGVSAATLAYGASYNALWVSPTYPLTGIISGYLSATSAAPTSASFSFNSATQTVSLSQSFFNITNIQITNSRPLIGASFSITVASNAVATAGNTLATLAGNSTAGALYTLTGKSYQGLSSSAVQYNQQNGQGLQTWTLSSTTGPTAGGLNQIATYTMRELAIPTTTTNDVIAFAIYNSTAGVGGTQFLQLNYSTAGTRNNVTYTGTQGTSVNAQAGFRTERGSKVASITPSMDTFSIAKSIDYLDIAVGTVNATVSGKTYALYGPYGVGQATNIANVSIGKVTANITVGAGAQYNITGISNIQAVPSVASATTPVLLKNLSSTAPLVVLDTQAAAAPQSNYILVGSGFVNSLSKQLQISDNVTFTPGSAPVFQAYGANRILVAGFYGNQTEAAADSFINALYQQATV